MKKHLEKEVKRWLTEGEKILEILGRILFFFLNEIRKGLKIILSRQNSKLYLQRLQREIISVAELSLDKRMERVKMASRWLDDSRNYHMKSITLF